jgi:hypothetical protein
LELTYGGGQQSYMMPLSEYYGLTPDKRLRIRVYFLCTPNLSADDVKNLGEYLNWTKSLAARDCYLSTKEGRWLGSISKTKSKVAAQAVSPENTRWIHEVVYKADSELNIRKCGDHRKNISYHDGYFLVQTHAVLSCMAFT